MAFKFQKITFYTVIIFCAFRGHFFKIERCHLLRIRIPTLKNEEF